MTAYLLRIIIKKIMIILIIQLHNNNKNKDYNNHNHNNNNNNNNLKVLNHLKDVKCFQCFELQQYILDINEAYFFILVQFWLFNIFNIFHIFNILIFFNISPNSVCQVLRLVIDRKKKKPEHRIVGGKIIIIIQWLAFISIQ